MVKQAAQAVMKEAMNSVEQIEVSEVDAASLDDWFVLDVREDQEFAGGHIPGALSMPRSRLEMMAMQSDVLEAAAGNPMLVYCGSGKRSLLAAATLKSLGVERPVSMNGGFQAWTQAGKPVGDG